MNNILINAINHYDNEALKFNKLLQKLCKELNLEIDKDEKTQKIIDKLINKDYVYIDTVDHNNIYGYGNFIVCSKNEKINYIKSRFFILGNIYKSYWYWNWISEADKYKIFKSQQILRYGLDIDIISDDSTNSNLINLITRGLLINGKIEISKNSNQMFLIKALGVFLTNSNVIVEIKGNNSDIKNLYVLFDIENFI